MSGHWNKVVAGACKPKHAPPKPKYIDALVSSTYQADGSLQDVTRALALRLRDPSSTVVFKALIVIHTLIRAGNSQEVMLYWSGADGRDGKLLGLSTVVGTDDSPQNLSKYSKYLESRLKCFAAIKYDPIRIQQEAPARLRDSRLGPNRLRTLTVDKGLLREVSILQKLLDSMVDCKFWLEDTSDDLVMTALRIMTKDLLVLFQSLNEGVINVLEHYFEMSKVDATQALKMYRIFCRQCEKVVAYLGLAKKLEHILNVNVPNLRHAPVSLAVSLQEYLDDPDFEKNREEYKENKRIADGKPKTKQKEAASASTTTSAEKSKPVAPSTPETEGSTAAFVDFFESIEQEQQSMFNPQTNSPSTAYFQQQSGYNPFGGYVQPQVQPQMLMQQDAFGGGMAPQQTGFPTAGPSMGNAFFGVQPQQTGAAFGMGSTMQPNNSGFLAPQMTGGNPFRQSMMMTGQLQQQQPQLTGLQQAPMVSQATGYNPFMAQAQGSMLGSPFGTAVPNRANGASSAPPQQVNRSFSATPTPSPLAAQPTGSRNPFAPAPGQIPPVPKPPAGTSMNSLAASAWSHSMAQAQTKAAAERLQAEQAAAREAASGNQPSLLDLNSSQPPEQKKDAAFTNFFASQLNRLEGGGNNVVEAQKTGAATLFSSVASEFAVTRPKSAGENPFPTSQNFGSAFATSNETTSPTPSALVPQMTGFGGSAIKPFKPTSSFGASLASSLPSLPENGTPLVNAPTGLMSSTNSSFVPSMTTQMTGVNPFRMSTLPTGSGMTSNSTGSVGGTSSSFSMSQPTGLSTAFPSSSSSFGTGPTSISASGFGGVQAFQPSSSFGQNQFGNGMSGSNSNGVVVGSNLNPTLQQQSHPQPPTIDLMGF